MAKTSGGGGLERVLVGTSLPRGPQSLVEEKEWVLATVPKM